MLKVLDTRIVLQNGYGANNFSSHLITRDDTHIATMRRSAFQYDGIKIADKIPDNPAGGEFLPVTNNKERSDAVCPRKAHFLLVQWTMSKVIDQNGECHILVIKPDCASEPIPSPAQSVPFCCSWSSLLQNNLHYYQFSFLSILSLFIIFVTILPS